MQKKKLRVAVGRVIRAATGVSLPIAMAVAKAAVKAAPPTMTVAEIAAFAPRAFVEAKHAASEYELPAGVSASYRECGCGCGTSTMVSCEVIGPRGSIVA
jgi:hypothetical protein